MAVEALDEDAVDAVLLHPSEVGVYDTGAVGFEERGLRSVWEDEVAGEETLFGVLLYCGEGIELHFEQLVI